MSISTPLNLPFPLAPVTQNDIIRVLGEYTFIRLDNGDEAFYHHGNWITGADACCGEPSVLGLAQSMARAGCKSLRCVELPVPDDAEWSWEDVVTQLVRASVADSGQTPERLARNLRISRWIWWGLMWLTGLPVAGFLFALTAAGSSIGGTGWLRVGCVMLVLMLLSATGFVQALASGYRLWQLTERRVSASENGSFQAYLQETRWCRQVLSGGLL